jgi:hypothetical protein
VADRLGPKLCSTMRRDTACWVPSEVGGGEESRERKAKTKMDDWRVLQRNLFQAGIVGPKLSFLAILVQRWCDLNDTFLHPALVNGSGLPQKVDGRIVSPRFTVKSVEPFQFPIVSIHRRSFIWWSRPPRILRGPLAKPPPAFPPTSQTRPDSPP